MCLAAGFSHAASRAVDPCAEFVARLPGVAPVVCTSAQLAPTTGRSVQGRILYARDVVVPTPKRRVLVVGAMHGDELTAGSLAFHWLQRAVQDPAGMHWRFIPVLNPDGLLGRPARRVNASGVDLNRNFPTANWEHESRKYWDRTKKDPRRWPGHTPLSEPESRFLHADIERFQPDIIVSIHAPYGMVDFDGPGVPPTQLGRLCLDQVGVFPGSLGNFGGLHKRTPVITIELAHALQMPQEAEMHQMWRDLLGWMDKSRGGIATASRATPTCRHG